MLNIFVLLYIFEETDNFSWFSDELKVKKENLFEINILYHYKCY